MASRGVNWGVCGWAPFEKSKLDSEDPKKQGLKPQN